MHQDQRIGLALAVLLIGACAAFFFRNETVDVSNAPRLKHAQELDDRIAERTTRPYLKGIETVEAADRAQTPSEAGNPPVNASHGRAFLMLIVILKNSIRFRFRVIMQILQTRLGKTRLQLRMLAPVVHQMLPPTRGRLTLYKREKRFRPSLRNDLAIPIAFVNFSKPIRIS